MIPVKRLLSVGVMSLFKLLSSSRNNNNKGSRSNEHELVYGESSSNARDYHLCYCLQSLLLLLRKN